MEAVKKSSVISYQFCSEKFGEALCFQRGSQQGFADFSCFAGVAKRHDHSVKPVLRWVLTDN